MSASHTSGGNMLDEPDRQRATLREVLAIREFRALYVAQTLSVVGDQLARIAVAVLVFSRTGSTTLTGVSYAMSYLPWLVGGPTLSVLADRYPRRTVMIVCDLGRGLLITVTAIAIPPTGVLICLVIGVALLEPPFASARAALVPDIVGTADRYVAASTLGNATSQVAVVVGFAVGGTTISALGAAATLAVDSATFVASGLVCALAIASRSPAATVRSSWRGEMRVGAAVILSDGRLRWLVAASWLIVGVVITTEAVAIPYARLHGSDYAVAGMLTASVPAGITVGAVVLGRFMRKECAEQLLPTLTVATPLLLLATGLNLRPAITTVIWFAAGGTSAMTVVANRIFVASIRPEIRGRAFGVAAAGISTAQGVGSLLVGLIAQFIGPARAVAALAGAALVGAFLMTVGMKEARRELGRSRLASPK